MGVIYLLETDTCVEIIRARTTKALDVLQQKTANTVGVSAITLAELCYGAYRSSDPARNLAALQAFVQPLTVLNFDDRAAEAYGRVRTALDRTGTPIGPLDTLIAAHALSLRLILVTNNEREFRRVPGLSVENWLADD